MTEGRSAKRKRNGLSAGAKKAMYYKTAGSTIHPGVGGIFVTCNRYHEKQCRQELMLYFRELADKIYEVDKGIDNEQASAIGDDIETSILKEVQALHEIDSTSSPLFTPIDVDCECVIFFRTRKPIDPASFVHRICSDAFFSKEKSTRHTLRLSPVTLTASASEDGLIELAKKVLKPHFHENPENPIKFAIRPTLRNHSVLDRDTIIRLVANIVGPSHKVDLKHYDKLILVECFKNIIGISVVEDFEKFKRFNLQAIFESLQTK
ncbi:uncharacterized protein V1516DRAFT_666578 [Lipomyces oligophaga]|uniref:uncharacterized protein n=1 Tax=Lipomyces oligophaga TaxID=45792 RepID=UPI0034CF9429